MKNSIVICFFISALLLSSCSEDRNGHFIFLSKIDWSIIWQGKGKVSIENYLRREIDSGRIGIPETFFDKSTRKLYLVFDGRIQKSRFNDKSYIYEVKDNNKIESNCYSYIFKRTSKNIGSHIYGIDNNVVLAASSCHNYELFNLHSGFIKLIDIDECILYPIDFVDDKIFFNEGFYDCDRNMFVFYPEEWDITKKEISDETNLPYITGKYRAMPRVSADGKKIVARNKKGYICIFDINTKKSCPTNINRKLDSYTSYSGNLLYYMDGNTLYYSRDTFFSNHSLARIFSISSWYPLLNWYSYNLTTGQSEKINSPKGTVYILGKMDGQQN